MKRFLEWIKIKEKIHKEKMPPTFEEREIWWISLGENVGHEENGRGNDFVRPFVIIRKFNKELLFGVPCSSISKENKEYYTPEQSVSTQIVRFAHSLIPQQSCGVFFVFCTPLKNEPHRSRATGFILFATFENKYYFKIVVRAGNFKTSALLSQVKTISSRRLLNKIDKMGDSSFVDLKKALEKTLLKRLPLAFARVMSPKGNL